jgi:hypothetical protein
MCNQVPRLKMHCDTVAMHHQHLDYDVTLAVVGSLAVGMGYLSISCTVRFINKAHMGGGR